MPVNALFAAIGLAVEGFGTTALLAMGHCGGGAQGRLCVNRQINENVSVFCPDVMRGFVG